MRLAHLTASTAALLLSSTALMAQSAEGTAGTLSNVYVDVGGQAVYVPIDIAAQACGQDQATLLQTAQTNLSTSGMDVMQAYGIDQAGFDASISAGAAAGAMDDTASADASGAAATTGTDASGATTDTASADTSTGAVSTDMESTDTTATADASGAASTDAGTTDVQNVEPTAADTSGADQQLLALAVCQIDEATAASYSIDTSMTGMMGMGSAGGTDQ